MKKHYEIDRVVAFTKCPCCQADIEVRERFQWGYFEGGYEVVPVGAPDERLSRQEYQKILSAQHKTVFYDRIPEKILDDDGGTDEEQGETH